MSPVPSLAQTTPSLTEAKFASACIPVALRSRVAAALAVAAKAGGTPDVVVRRALVALDRRILTAQRQHRDDLAAELTSDAIEQFPDAALAIAGWALTWATEAEQL